MPISFSQDPSKSDLIVVCECAELTATAQALAMSLSLPLTDTLPANASLILSLDRQGLALRATGKDAPGSLRVDFGNAGLSYRQHVDKSRELLAKAIGVSGLYRPCLWDVTAGLGQDAWILAGLGCEVYLFERQPIVHALLKDGLDKARTGDDPMAKTAARMHLSLRDGIDALTDRALPRPDIVYVDPMFPTKRKNAKAKKAMQYFQLLVGSDDDGEQLLSAALDRAHYRVIVKRPISAPPLSATKPSSQIMGKTIRLDIYALQSSKRYLEEKNSQTR